MTSETPEPLARLLELVAVADPGDEASAEAEQLASAVDDHEALLGAAARHRMVAALAEFLVRTGRITGCPTWFQHIAAGTLDLNRHRNQVMTTEALRLAELLRDAGVGAVFTKGIVCQTSLYDGEGRRFFADIDLMCRPDQSEALSKALTAGGYAAEHQFNPLTGALTELSRETKVLYRLYPDHLPHFHLLTPAVGVRCFRVDVALSLTWHTSAWQVPMDLVMSDVDMVDVDGGALPTLTPEFGFLFFVLHLFRECWFQLTAGAGGLRLTQFADIVKFWRRFGADAAARIRAEITRHELEAVVAWITHHTDAVFGTDITDALGLGAYRDEAWLASAGATGGYLSWHGNMRSRLHSRTTVQFSPTPCPPYAERAQVRRR